MNYTVTQAAALLNCSVRRVYYLIQRGRLHALQRRPTLIPESSLHALLNDPKRQKALARQRTTLTTRTKRISLYGRF